LFAPQSPTQFLLSGNSEGEYLDKPTLVNDGYRLSTLHNHAYHLGNTLEPWMGETMDSISKAQKVEVHWPAYRSLKKSTCRFWIKNRLFKKALTYPYIYNSCIKKFKLPAVYQNHYLKK
ncbi:MAG: hypothetical protein NWQ19_02370, partial [Nonlabens sp.]|nr:hypothetical protein [Nonlabens sp.]